MKLRNKLKLLFTKNELKRLFVLFFGILILGVFEVVGVTAVVPFIAVVISPEIVFENDYLLKLYNFLNFQDVSDFIFFLGAVLISAILISNLYQAFMTWVITRFTSLQAFRLSTRLLEKYLNQNYSFFLNRNTSDLSKNVLSEVNRVTSGVIMQSLTVLSKLVIVMYLLAVLVYIDPLIAFISAVCLGGIYALIFKFFKRKLYSKGLQMTQSSFEVYKATNEAMSGIKDIKLHSNEGVFLNRYSLPAKRIASIQAQTAVIYALPRYLLEVVAFGGIVTIVISLISLNDGMNSSIFPVISLYAMIGYRLLPAFQQIYSGVSALKFNLPAFENLVQEFRHSDPFKKEFNKTGIISFKDKVSINQVNFKYKSSETSILNNVELEIFKNTTVGLVGSTGSGKTTLIDIILALLEPNSGFISIDDIEINSKNKSGWQKQIGYVPQSIYLIDDSILSNIAFAVPYDEINLEKAKKAAKIANLDSFIQTLPDHYDTLVGERGVRLSGGQRQRIGIARALYYDPDVLVLDEATSSLDGITEDIIIDAIKTLSHKKTIIMIAHRMTTVRDCDNIFLMSDGEIEESGTYNYLMSNSEKFRSMTKKV